jgi:protein BCP1
MYKMVSEELEWAVDERNEPFTFGHLVFVSRTYHLTTEEESELSNAPPDRQLSEKKAKKAKKAAAASQGAARPQDGIYPFHPEDECIRQVCALIFGTE